MLQWYHSASFKDGSYKKKKKKENKIKTMNMFI